MFKQIDGGREGGAETRGRRDKATRWRGRGGSDFSCNGYYRKKSPTAERLPEFLAELLNLPLTGKEDKHSTRGEFFVDSGYLGTCRDEGA